MRPAEFLQRAVRRLRLLPWHGWSRRAVLRLLGAHVSRGAAVGRIHVTWPHQVSIGPGCQIEDDVCFKYDGPWKPGPRIILEDRVFVGRQAEFNITVGIRVASDARIASGCRFIDHDHGIEPVGSWQGTAGVEAPIVLEEDVWLGVNVVVLRGVTVGRGAIVGAGAVVTKSIPAYEIWAGVPARRIGARPTAVNPIPVNDASAGDVDSGIAALCQPDRPGASGSSRA